MVALPSLACTPLLVLVYFLACLPLSSVHWYPLVAQERYKMEKKVAIENGILDANGVCLRVYVRMRERERERVKGR
jgi:hypothetical protein